MIRRVVEPVVEAVATVPDLYLALLTGMLLTVNLAVLLWSLTVAPPMHPLFFGRGSR